MGFIRENITKIIIFIVVMVVLLIAFSLLFGKKDSKIPSYDKMESTLLSSAKKYATDNKKLIPNSEDESNKINLDTLVNSKYINELTAIEDSNIKCSGYVELLYKNKGVMYVPYLKCGKYYETQTIADYIISHDEPVTSGDGLYKYGDLYVFRGENVNNYLGIGNRLYRILDINEDGEVRLLSDKRFEETFVWDDRYNIDNEKYVGINDFSKSRLKEYLNYVVDKNDTDEKSQTNYFSQKEMEKMVEHDICVGKRSVLNGAIDSSNECQKVEPNQKVSLITVSDYARASIDPNCKSIFDVSCTNYNYLENVSSVFRTLTAVSENSYQVFYIGEGVAEVANASASFKTNIVIYIDRLSLYAKGDGTSDNPYIIR